MLALDPFDAVAISLAHSRGEYAVLVGSGLSRAAGIPTGWEITLDLVRRLAALSEKGEIGDPAAWYQTRYGKAPSYSELLDALAPTPAERRTILHSYIEAAADQETRRPTKAHMALAQLVAVGSVRVIVTTNFDRLIESALRQLGIEPIIISSEDGLAGATPLVHANCVLVKVHGDYLDARILNTEAELASYPPALDAYLNQIFDQFGLLVVGWSGEWDEALRKAMLRAPTRRYPVFWAHRGAPSGLGEDLISHRRATKVPIDDADAFLPRLADTVEQLKSARRQHPDSVASAMALAKRYCRDADHAAEWALFLNTEAGKVREFITSDAFPTSTPEPASINALVQEIFARTEILRRALLFSARWGTAEANRAAVRTIGALALSSTARGGYVYWTAMRDFAASLCFHWTCAGAVDRHDWALLRAVLHQPIRTSEDSNGCPAVSALPMGALPNIEWKVLTGHERQIAPQSHWLASALEPELGDIGVPPDEAAAVFDEAEFLIALDFADLRLKRIEASPGLWFWFPPGMFIWRRSARRMDERLAEYKSLSPSHPAIKAGLFGGSSERAAAAAAKIEETLRTNTAYFR